MSLRESDIVRRPRFALFPVRLGDRESVGNWIWLRFYVVIYRFHKWSHQVGGIWELVERTTTTRAAPKPEGKE